MRDRERLASEALAAIGFTRPGPKLAQFVVDAIAREEEGGAAGVRRHQFDYAELLKDTPELLDRAEGSFKDPGTDTS